MERKQQWFRSDLRYAISPGPLPFAQVENLPEEFNDLTKKLYHKFTIYLMLNIANNTGPERDVLLSSIWIYTVAYALFIDVASDVGVNLCNVKSCLNTSNNE